MTRRHRLVIAAVTLVAGSVAAAVPAAAMPSSAIELRASVPAASLIDKTASRRCWWRNGKRHCVRTGGSRVSGYRNRGGDYYEHIPEKLPYGSSSWWDQMVRENRGGNPGGGRD